MKNQQQQEENHHHHHHCHPWKKEDEEDEDREPTSRTETPSMSSDLALLEDSNSNNNNSSSNSQIVMPMHDSLSSSIDIEQVGYYRPHTVDKEFRWTQRVLHKAAGGGSSRQVVEQQTENDEEDEAGNDLDRSRGSFAFDPEEDLGGILTPAELDALIKKPLPASAPPPTSILKNASTTSTTTTPVDMEQVKKLAVLKLERRFLESDIDTLLVEVPTFDIRELTIGKRLGSGCYSNVDEVRGIHLLQDQDSIQPRRRDSIAPNNKESKKFIAEHCIRESGDSRYALKKVRTDILRSNLQTAVEGLSDIAVEARFLASLNQHPNVIKLRGMASASHGTPDFFLLLDRLYDTLEQRITKMAAKKKRIMRSLHWGGFNFSSCLPGRRQQKRVEYLELYEDLIGYGYDIAAALDYCHKNKVIHRDCKPMNIGFDVRDDLKIFDFGLSCEMKRSLKDKDGTYKLTGQVGPLRYMPPEVWRGQPYNESYDVYSFALVLWSLLSLKKIFAEIHDEKHRERQEENHVAKVIEGGYRPPIKARWNQSLREIMENGWSEDLKARPSMEDIKQKLRHELVRCRNGDDSGIDDERRRSTFIFDEQGHMNSLEEAGILDLSLRSSVHSAPDSPRSARSPFRRQTSS